MAENKPIMLKEVSETGFYCAINDNERYYIFEVLNNTDEEWLKETPEQTLLIDEWIYDYTDYDDRKVYGTSGNLVATCNDISTCKVYKIEDTKYKIFGSVGQFLIEDKPTYKEQLSSKTQECEKIKNWVKSKMFYTDCVNWFERFVYAFDDWQTDLQQQLDQLKTENEKLKKDRINIIKENSKDYRKLQQSEQKLKRIKQVCKDYCKIMCLCETKETCESCINTEVLQIIDEVENE